MYEAIGEGLPWSLLEDARLIKGYLCARGRRLERSAGVLEDAGLNEALVLLTIMYFKPRCWLIKGRLEDAFGG
jgi:hypothetical protein